jgi:hypothetical protein
MDEEVAKASDYLRSLHGLLNLPCQLIGAATAGLDRQTLSVNDHVLKVPVSYRVGKPPKAAPRFLAATEHNAHYQTF